jgi:hypothetical protein
MEKLYQSEPVYIKASLMPKFPPKIILYAVLNWKIVQFLESHQFWWIWKKMFVFKIPLIEKLN